MGELVERLVLGWLRRWWANVKPVRRSVGGLIAIAVIVGLVIGYFGASWYLRGQMENKDTLIALQLGMLAQKDDYIKELESRSAGADVRDDQALYQEGFSVAFVQNPQIDAENQTLMFEIVTASRKLDMTRGFEFRDWTIVCRGNSSSSMTMGAVQMINYYNVVCRLMGDR